MARFKKGSGDWTTLRAFNPIEVDFHYGRYEGPLRSDDRMAVIQETVLKALIDAQRDGVSWVLFRHGASTSYGWKKTTVRSVVRGVMRSREATPLILRAECVQHETVFLSCIRLNRSATEKSPTH